MAKATLNRVVEVPIYTAAWDCPHCPTTVTPQAIVSMEGTTGTKRDNGIKAPTVELELKGEVLGVRMPPHICASAMAPGSGYEPAGDIDL